MEEKKKSRTWQIIFIGSVLIVLYKLLDKLPEFFEWLKNFFGVMMPINIGILIAIFLYLPVRFFEKKLEKSGNKFVKRKANALSIWIGYIIAIAVLTLIGFTIFPILYESGKELFTNIGSYSQALVENVDKLSQYGVDVNYIKESIKNIDFKQFFNLSSLASYTKGIVGFGSGVLDVFVAIVISIYILYERKNIYKFLLRIFKANFPNSAYLKIKKYSDNAITIFVGFISAQLFDALIVGVLETIMLLILNVKYAPLLGFFIGLSNIIPYFGAIVGVIVSFLITIFSGGLVKALWMLVFVVVIQQIDSNIINPKIVGQQLKISPLLVIISVVVGGAYFGVSGMFLAVPFAALLKLILIDSIDIRLKEKEKNLRAKKFTLKKEEKI